MRLNFSKSSKKNKSTYVNSTHYPGAGYVAIPENEPSKFDRKKDTKRRKGLQQELRNIVSISKQLLYDICVYKKKERGKA